MTEVDSRFPGSRIHTDQLGSAEGIELAVRLPLPSSSSILQSSTQIELDEDGSEAEYPNNATSLAPVDGGFGAWSFLVGAFLIETVVWGFPTSYGVFLQAYLEDPKIASQPHASSVLPLVGTLSSGIIYCSGPIIYPLTSRFPIHRRTSMWIGVVLCFVSLFGASYATTVPQLIALQGVLYAVGASLAYAPTLSFMSEWFVKRRGMANGVMFAGTALGGLFLPLILPPLFRTYGPAVTLRYLSIAVLACLLPVVPFIRPRLPEHRVHGPGRRAEDRSWLKDGRWWFLVAATTIQGFAYFVPIVWLPTYASAMNAPASTAALSVALLNGASVVGRLGLGFLADHVSPWLLAMSTLLAASAATFLLWGLAGNVTAGLLAFGIVYGLVASGWSSLWTGFVRPLAKDDPALSTSLFGFLLLSRGLGNVLSTPISNALFANPSVMASPEKTGFDVDGGRYEHMIIYVGTCFAGAAIVALAGWGRERAAAKRGE